jgi:3-oxoacyl-[acyl-carrier-protein] synthase-3
MPRGVFIEAVAHELAPHSITSLEIESQIRETLERLSIPLGNLERLTGIRTRGFWDPGTQPSEVASSAGRSVIEKAGIDPARIGCVISTSVSKDYIEPAVACLVHRNLGLAPNCRSFDISNACLGFLDAIDVLGLMLEAGDIDYGLIVDGESAREPVEATLRRLSSPDTSLQDFMENFATLTIGSGAAAILLTSGERATTSHRVNGSFSLSRTEHAELCVAQRFEGKTDASAMLRAGVELAVEAWKLTSSELGRWSDEAIDLYLPHQVSVGHTRAIIGALGLSPEKVFMNVESLGNVGPASVVIALGMALDQERLRAGDHAALLGIGSGLTCTGLSISW